MVRALVENDLIRTPGDLYHLNAQDVAKLDRMGEKSAENLIAAIEKSKQQDLSRLISAFGIRQVGTRGAQVLAERFRTLDALMAADEETLTEVPDVGAVTAHCLVEWFHNPQSQHLVETLREAGVNMECRLEQRDGRFDGMTFVLTGTLTRFDRKTAENEIVLRGARPAAPCRKRPPMWWRARLRAAS